VRDRRFTFAFQPIVDIASGDAIAYEALIRGTAGEPAEVVLSRYPGEHLLQLDHDARLAAIQLAASLHLQVGLSLNFSPAVLDQIPDSLGSTIAIARASGMRPEQLILEVTEGSAIGNPAAFAELVNAYRSEGIRLAIDDFGAGYAGLNLLAEFQPDIVKIDMGLVRDINSKGPRQAIVRAVVQACTDLGLEVLAEGVESREELNWLAQRGIQLFQGFLFGRPAFQQIPQPSMPLREAQTSRAAAR
jgi:blue light- and temperature-responsive anti-repressor